MTTTTLERRQLTLDEAPRPQPAPAKEQLPPAQDLKPLIAAEHIRAELQRLDDGWPGCGCADCQELYKTIDLKKYGSRVARYGDQIVIAAGRQSKDTDHWLDDGTFFCGGKRWGVSASGATVSYKDAPETPPNSGETQQEGQNAVTKLSGGVIVLPTTDLAMKNKAVMLHPGGRPLKEGPVTRMTAWRRSHKRVKK